MQAAFSEKTIQFLNKAGKQRDESWLDKHKPEYQRVLKEPFSNLAHILEREIHPLASDYHFPLRGVGRLKKPSHKRGASGSVFKDWVAFSACRPPRYRFEASPHLFFGILPNDSDWEGVVVAGGLYLPSSTQLRQVRNAIAKNSQPFHDLFRDPEFKKRFKGGFQAKEKDCAKRVPKGFDPDHPDIAWIKLKSFIVVKKLSMREFSSPNLATGLIKDYRQLLRLNELLQEVLDGPGGYVKPTPDLYM